MKKKESVSKARKKQSKKKEAQKTTPNKEPKTLRVKKLLYKSRNYIFTMFVILFFATLFGVLLPSMFESQVIELLNEIFLKVGDKRGLELITHIFLNNTQASFFAIIIGMFFGIFPVVSALINGYVIGFTMQYVSAQEGLFILWRLVPHGIFEIPAILISMGIGLYLGARLLEEAFSLKDKTMKSLILFVIIIFSVIFFAGYLLLSQSIPIEAIENGTELSNLPPSDLFVVSVLAALNTIMFIGLVIILVIFLKHKTLRQELIDSLWLFILVIIPLLVVAGIIEGLLITFFP